MKNQDRNLVLFIIYVIVASTLITSLSSCGARKVQKSVVEESLKTEVNHLTDSSLQKSTEIVTNVNEDCSEVEITPIDPLQVLLIDGKVYKNAKFRIVNKKVKTAVVAKEKVKAQTSIKTKAVAVAKKGNKHTAIDRKGNSWYQLLWFLIPVGLYVAYQRFKDKLWFI